LTKFSVKIIPVGEFCDRSGKKKTYQAKNHPGKRRRKTSFYRTFQKLDSLINLSYQKGSEDRTVYLPYITLPKPMFL
jgi:hypothetical protein